MLIDRSKEFFSKALNKTCKLVQLHDGDVWLCYKHPDGQFVTLRQATNADLFELNLHGLILELSCRVCHCTDSQACMTNDGPCHWVEPDLCSGCAGKEEGR